MLLCVITVDILQDRKIVTVLHIISVIGSHRQQSLDILGRVECYKYWTTLISIESHPKKIVVVVVVLVVVVVVVVVVFVVIIAGHQNLTLNFGQNRVNNK